MSRPMVIREDTAAEVTAIAEVTKPIAMQAPSFRTAFLDS
jgi:hypothetical protein